MEDNGVIQSTFHTLSKPNIHEMIMTNTSEWQTQNAKCSRIPHDLKLNTLITIIDLGLKQHVHIQSKTLNKMAFQVPWVKKQ